MRSLQIDSDPFASLGRWARWSSESDGWNTYVQRSSLSDRERSRSLIGCLRDVHVGK